LPVWCAIYQQFGIKRTQDDGIRREDRKVGMQLLLELVSKVRMFRIALSFLGQTEYIRRESEVLQLYSRWTWQRGEHHASAMILPPGDTRNRRQGLTC